MRNLIFILFAFTLFSCNKNNSVTSNPIPEQVGFAELNYMMDEADTMNLKVTFSVEQVSPYFMLTDNLNQVQVIKVHDDVTIIFPVYSINSGKDIRYSLKVEPYDSQGLRIHGTDLGVINRIDFNLKDGDVLNL